MDMGRSIESFTKLLNRYYGFLVRFEVKQSDSMEMSTMCGNTYSIARHSPFINCEIEFRDPERCSEFILTMEATELDLFNRRQLHIKYPQLKKAYEEYLILEKLCS